MKFIIAQMRSWRAVACSLALLVTATAAQDTELLAKNEMVTAGETTNVSAVKPILVSVLPNYYNQQDGISINQLIERALQTIRIWRRRGSTSNGREPD